jgi:hypothetical protein
VIQQKDTHGVQKELISLLVGKRCFFNAWLMWSADGERGLDIDIALGLRPTGTLCTPELLGEAGRSQARLVTGIFLRRFMW